MRLYSSENPYCHSVLFTELSDSQLVHGGGHVLHSLLQVLGVTLHQGPGDATATMLEEGRKGAESLDGWA